MKLLLSSHLFSPSVGGIEAVSLMLAQEFEEAGHEVKVTTQTPEVDSEPFPFAVMRRPSARTLLEAVEWSDIYFQNNISLQSAWPLLIHRRPWVVAHHTWITRAGGRHAWQDQLKHWALPYTHSIAVSQALANSLPGEVTLLRDPYDDTVFRLAAGEYRPRELLFVGRLVSDKGADLVLSALAQLKHTGHTPNLTVVGEGPEAGSLRQLAGDLGVSSQVDFVGRRTGLELARVLNAHQILVVPSRWDEPFGIVALEGIACGCVVVGSEGGGLPEAIGLCGVTFQNGNARGLADVLRLLIEDARRRASFRTYAQAHLAPHRRAEVAATYLKFFADLLGQPPASTRWGIPGAAAGDGRKAA